MVSETTRLRLYPMTYPRKDKYKSRYIVQKRESGYKRRQSRHTDAQRRVMDITNNKSRQNTYHTTQTRTSPSNGKKNMRMDQKRGNKTTKKKRTDKHEKKMELFTQIARSMFQKTDNFEMKYSVITTIHQISDIQCHDLAKWLSYFLFSFSFFISFIQLNYYKGKAWERSHITVTKSQNGHITGHGHKHVTGQSHDEQHKDCGR